MEKRYIIALDLSLNETGYAVFDLTKRNPLIDKGTIQNNHYETEEEGKKLFRIEMVMATLRNSYYPAVLVMEEWLSAVQKSGQVNRNNGYTSAYKLGGVHGICKKVFYDIKPIFINNKTMKKQFTGRGDCEKQDVIDKCYEIKEKLVGKAKAAHFTIVNDNDADAIGLGVCYLQNVGRWK